MDGMNNCKDILIQEKYAYGLSKLVYGNTFILNCVRSRRHLECPEECVVGEEQTARIY